MIVISEGSETCQFYKRLFSVNSDEQKVLDAIKESGLKSMRVIGRGTLVVDAKEVTSTDKFKVYAREAKKIVEQSS